MPWEPINDFKGVYDGLSHFRIAFCMKSKVGGRDGGRKARGKSLAIIQKRRRV